MENDFAMLAIKEETKKLIKEQANKKGMYIHRYVQQLVENDNKQKQL